MFMFRAILNARKFILVASSLRLVEGILGILIDLSGGTQAACFGEIDDSRKVGSTLTMYHLFNIQLPLDCCAQVLSTMNMVYAAPNVTLFQSCSWLQMGTVFGVGPGFQFRLSEMVYAQRWGWTLRGMPFGLSGCNGLPRDPGQEIELFGNGHKFSSILNRTFSSLLAK